MRFVVTGCSGFIGSHLVDALLTCGHEVTGVDAFTDYYARSIKESNLCRAVDQPSFSLIEADLAAAELTPLVENVDGVFHLAAQPGVRGSWGDSFGYYLRDNLLATQRLFEAAAHARARVVFASSSSVYGNAETYPTHEDVLPRPVSPYGVTKFGCEQLAHTYASSFGLEVVCLRYFSVYGPRQRPDMAFARIIEALRHGHPFTILGTGAQIRDFTYVADAVEATIAGMERGRPGSTYNVGGGSPTSLRSAIAVFERLTGAQLNVRHTHASRGDAKHTAADTTRSWRDLGWTPRTSLLEGASAQFAAAARRWAAAAA